MFSLAYKNSGKNKQKHGDTLHGRNNVDFSTSEITSKKVRRNLVFVISKSNRRGFDVVCPLGNFSTPNRHPISYSYQVLLFPYNTAAAQTTPYKYSFQHFLPATPSYSCQLLLSSTINKQSLLLLTVSAILINQSFQLLFSGSAIR